MADKIKKLSQAIRLGATFRPQCTNGAFEYKDGKTVGSCALGAAYEAVFGIHYKLEPHRDITFAPLFERFPEVPNHLVPEIARRNDWMGHTREQIADWLEAQGY